jgi:hypothetical protein
MPSVVIPCTVPTNRPAASTTDFIAIFCQLILRDQHTQNDRLARSATTDILKRPRDSDAGTAAFTSDCANNQRQEGTSRKRQEPRKASQDLSNF